MAYSKRNLNQNQNQQAYFTAVSAVDLVARQFTGVLDKKSPQQQIVTQLESGKTFTITDMALPKEMGSCTVTLSMRNRDIVITAEATSGGESYCLSGIMNGEVSIIHDPNRPIYGDTGTPGVGVGSINGSYATSVGSNGLRTDPGTDIYIWDSNPFTLNTQPPFEAAHMGALYTNGKVSLSSETFPFYTHVHGEIISTNDVTLTGYSTVGLLPDELLPLGRRACCYNNTTPEPNPDTGMVSAIESSGKVSVSGGGRVGGGITAKEISISNSRVCGDLRGETISVTDFDTWNVSDYYTVKGNITGNSVTIGRNAIILGDITADTLKISGGYPKITGTIIARNIVCDFKSDVQYGITGNILAGNITLNNTSEIDGKVEADLLTMNNNSKINGDVYANKLIMNTSGGTSISGNLSYYQGGGSGSIDSRVGGTVTRLKAPLPAITMPEPLKPITIALPPKPTQPTLPPLPPKAQPLGSGYAKAVGNVGEDSYYIIGKNKTNINTLTVTGDNNVFVYIKDNCTA
ncbi:MAG: polymer-forming cytoskeletal protein, partial [Angelakisella sp.]